MELFVIKNLYLGTEKLLFIMKLLITIKFIPVIIIKFVPIIIIKFLEILFSFLIF